mmetsp:Transcript_13914/g.20763  ORF Transcript_13914/g.20763 Transcript_13914/m.20763 type:complete len:441 (-) Transcript_13914:50-1372(-)
MTSFLTHRHRTKKARTRSRSSLAKFMVYAFLTLLLLTLVWTLCIHKSITMNSNDNENTNNSESAFLTSFISPSTASTASTSSSSSVTIKSTNTRPKSISRSLITNNQLFQTVLKRDHGKGWEILRNDGIVTNTGITESNPYGYKCRWSEFQSTSGNTAQMCVHDFFDFVSSSINRKKRWNDCDVLPKLWNATKTKSKTTTTATTTTAGTGDNNIDGDDDDDDDDDGLYVEIGANIGSCVMEMLLSTNANIIAFEPHPRNLFHLRSTISKLHPSLQNRVLIVPTALGGASATSKIYSAKNNMGNSVVGRVIKDYETQEIRESEQHEISIERLDSILDVDAFASSSSSSSHTHAHHNSSIRLMKMDAQGFECHVLDGMGRVIPQHIQSLHFEFARKWLQGQECLDLLPRVRGIGFDIYRDSRKIESDTLDLEVVELLGKRRK